MRRAGRWACVILAIVATAVVSVSPGERVLAAPTLGPLPNCAALTLHLAPGLHPPAPRFPFRSAPDAPRTPFAITVPLYPGLTPLLSPAGSPFSSYQETPYLQTASAQFHSTARSETIAAWYSRYMRMCGWRTNGSWDGNAGTFPHGISFARGPGGSLSTDIGFADKPDGSADVAIAIEGTRYPVPPAAARLHGPFVQLRIALRRIDTRSPVGSARTVQTIVTNRQVITHLVRAIDRISAAFTVPASCHGPLHTTGPAWLTFVRPNGAQVHAFEEGPGICGGGLEINGFRWLLDPGTVWSRILTLARVRR